MSRDEDGGFDGWDDWDPIDGFRIEFANPGSALRAAGPGNPRNLPCPTCGVANLLTPADQALGYQCDTCARRSEGVELP
jgi:hypothetical protein